MQYLSFPGKFKAIYFIQGVPKTETLEVCVFRTIMVPCRPVPMGNYCNAARLIWISQAPGFLYTLSSIHDRLQHRSICKFIFKVLPVELIYAYVPRFLPLQLTKGVQKSVNSDTRGQNVKIYSKLSTVMGVTWFLGFGAAHSTIVAYFYIIINSLQGKKLSKRRILKLDAVIPFI